MKNLKKALQELQEEKPGLWANIRAKRARGEKPAHKNSKAHKDAVKAGKKINKMSEGKQLDQVDFAKVVKAVEQTGHPVTVLLVPKFNEIEVLTGTNAPDDMLRDLSNAVDALGYGRNDIFIAADSTNLSRREYSDIRRVNGGHKEYPENF